MQFSISQNVETLSRDFAPAILPVTKAKVGG